MTIKEAVEKYKQIMTEIGDCYRIQRAVHNHKKQLIDVFSDADLSKIEFMISEYIWRKEQTLNEEFHQTFEDVNTEES